MLYRQRIADRDLGIECDFVALDYTKYGAWSKSIEHIRRHHRDSYDKVRRQIRERIVEEPTGETIVERRATLRIPRAAAIL